MGEGANVNVVRKLIRGLRNDITDELEDLRRSTQLPNYYRAVVEEVIFDPLELNKEDKDLLRTFLKDPFTVETIPRNSVIARRVRTKGETSFEPELLFPFFPSHLMLPVKAGEIVWVFYESHTDKHENGFWMCRVSERRDVEDVNYTHADRRFFPPPNKTTKAGEKAGVKGSQGANPFSFPNGLNTPSTHTITQTGKENAYDEIVESSVAAATSAVEPVPRWTPRPGDLALQGSNNTLISLGRKRSGPAETQPVDADSNIENLGAIDIVVGRGQGSSDPDTPDTTATPVENARGQMETNKSISDVEKRSEGDPDFKNDSARIYLAMKTSPDEDFQITIPEAVPFTVAGLEGTSGVNASESDRSTVVIKADQLRFISRSDIKLQVQNPNDPNITAAVVLSITGDIVFIPDSNGVIKLGGTDADKAILVTDTPASRTGGVVSGAPLQSTMGGRVGTTSAGQGTFATKVLIK